MSKALSVDLRERVVAAVTAGSSRRSAAARLKVSISSAIRWCAMLRDTGTRGPGPLGGDRLSQRIEGRTALILGLNERSPDMTLAEIQAEPARAGVRVGVGTVWRFFD